MKKYCFSFLLGVSLLFVSEAGVVVSGEGSGIAQKIYMAENSLRFDISGGEEEGLILFTGGGREKILRIIDKKENTFYELTSGDISKIKNMIEKAKTMMEQAIEKLPEAQREQMKNKMKEQMGAAMAERKVALEKRGERVNRWTVDRYAVYLDGKKSSLAWFADFGQFGLKNADFKVLEEFEKFWAPLASIGGTEGLMIIADRSVEGLPVKISGIDADGNEYPVFEVKDVKEQEIPNSVFKLPEGLEKKSFPLGGI